MINYQKIIRETIKECEKVTGVKCEVPIYINERLSKSLGRACAKITRNRFTGERKVEPTQIEFSKRFIEVATEEHLIDVIRHEFAHYCTFLSKGEHNHTDVEFISYCQKMDCCHNANSKIRADIKHKYDVYCKCCGKYAGGYDRASKVIKSVMSGQKGYVSGCCKSELRVEQNW